jgi:SAM-dependent methyltransferase
MGSSLSEAQDARVLGTCAELDLSLWYTVPCLVEHAPFRSAFETHDTYAPDFDSDFRLALGAGFQPPEDVPGWLTLGEGALLWRIAAGRDMLELGTASGRSTVCLARSARRVVSVDVADQSEAAEWVRRFGCANRVEFRRGDAADVCSALSGSFGLIFIDTLHDAASVTRDIASALPLLAPGGLLAFHDYPDLGWPDVRRVVDEHAHRLGWKRVEQADYLGVFRT